MILNTEDDYVVPLWLGVRNKKTAASLPGSYNQTHIQALMNHFHTIRIPVIQRGQCTPHIRISRWLILRTIVASVPELLRHFVVHHSPTYRDLRDGASGYNLIHRLAQFEMVTQVADTQTFGLALVDRFGWSSKDAIPVVPYLNKTTFVWRWKRGAVGVASFHPKRQKQWMEETLESIASSRLGATLQSETLISIVL